MHDAHGGALFMVGPLKVTSEVVTMWGIMFLLSLIAFLATRKLKDKPGKLQALAELAVTKLYAFFETSLGDHSTRTYFPFLGTLFIFIIASNYSGLLPGMGVIPGMKGPTSSLSVTAGISLFTFFFLQVVSIKHHGLKGYFKHFLKPVAFMLPFTLIDEIIRPFSLALRLYGNIFGEETVTEQLYHIIPIGAPLMMMAMSLLFCAIQAVVFSMLTSIYLEEAIGHEE